MSRSRYTLVSLAALLLLGVATWRSFSPAAPSVIECHELVVHLRSSAAGELLVTTPAAIIHYGEHTTTCVARDAALSVEPAWSCAIGSGKIGSY